MNLPRLTRDDPMVSIVVPMLDEAGAIEACLDSFAAQDWPAGRLDVIVVDGGSVDGSREAVEARARDCDWLRLIDNPRRKAAAAFNRGVDAAKGEVVCLFSSHGVAAPGYVRHSVAVLRETGAAGVGGRYLHEGLDPSSAAIGLAMVSPFGMASPHRFATRRTEVDTISHPAYVRDALLRVGPFDETLERNSDYELNVRVRDAGGPLVFDPSVMSVYRPRASLRALARQFWWYGRWKARVLRRHPNSLRLRHVAPPAALGVGVLTVLALPTRPGRLLALGLGAAYAAAVGTAVCHARPAGSDADPVVLAAAFPVMHGAWGAGMAISLVEDALRGAR